MNKIIPIFFLGISLFSCKRFETEYCDKFQEEYSIVFSSEDKDFEGCLFADYYGRVILIARDSQQAILHPLNGNYSNPISIEREEHFYKYIFNPIHDRKIFQLTGKRGWPGSDYELQYGDKMITFFSANEDLHAYEYPKILKPVWNSAVPNSAFLTSGNSSMEISNYEIAYSGINLVIKSYIFSDTLFLNLKLVNHSSWPVLIFPPEKIKANLIAISADKTYIRRGERYLGKFAFPVSDIEEFYIDNDMINFQVENNSIPIFRKDIPLKENNTDYF